MKPCALLTRLRRAGVRLTVCRSGLVVDAPRGVLSARDKRALARHARDVAALLTRGGQVPADIALCDLIDGGCVLLRLPAGNVIRVPLARGGKA